VQLAENAHRGALVARAGSADLVLLDIWMPDAGRHSPF